MIEILFPGMVKDQPEYYQDDKLLVTGTGTGASELVRLIGMMANPTNKETRMKG